MMGPRRLVLVKDLHLGDDAFFEAAAAYAEAPVPEAVVVLSGEGFPKVKKGSKDWRQRLKKALGRGGLWLELSTKNIRADQYACQVADELGKELSLADGRLLVEVLGDDLARIRQEVEKLSIYVGDAPAITADAIHEATAALAEAAIWDLTAALAAGDADAAIATLHRLQEGGDDPRRLLSMVAWQARDLCRIHARLKAGQSDSAIRSQVRIRPDVFRAAKARMAKHGFPHPGVLMGRLAQANLEMNSHRAGADRILERLVLDLVAAR
jgi:DNA polymerase-3 subunit delta